MAAHGPLAVMIRHGETEWSKNLRHTGRTDLPLTDKGRRMAALLKPALSEYHFVAVLVSPLQRARDTAALAGFGDRALVRPDLLEWDYGDYEGRTTAEIREQRPGWSIWDDSIPHGESLEDVGRRVDRIIEEVRAAEGDVALVAHGHVLRIFTARWLALLPDQGRLFALDTATISAVGYEREQPVLARWNERPHMITGS